MQPAALAKLRAPRLMPGRFRHATHIDVTSASPTRHCDLGCLVAARRADAVRCSTRLRHRQGSAADVRGNCIAVDPCGDRSGCWWFGILVSAPTWDCTASGSADAHRCYLCSFTRALAARRQLLVGFGYGHRCGLVHASVLWDDSARPCCVRTLFLAHRRPGLTDMCP